MDILRDVFYIFEFINVGMTKIGFSFILNDIIDLMSVIKI